MPRLRRFLFIGFVGLAPLWAAILFVAYESRQTQSADYWNVAPWFIILAIPVCVVSLGIAFVTLLMHDRSGGSGARKLARAALTFVVLTGIAVGGFLWVQHNKKNDEKAAQEDGNAAVEFVRADTRVQRAAGGPMQVSATTYLIRSPDTRPWRYDIHVRGPGKVRFSAIVDVARDAKGNAASFRIACLTKLTVGSRHAGVDACAQDESRGEGVFATDPGK